MKTRKTTVCDVSSRYLGVEGLIASPGVLPETKILRSKVQTFEMHLEKCFELGWLFKKDKIAKSIKEIVFFVACSFKKVGHWEVPMDCE